MQYGMIKGIYTTPINQASITPGPLALQTDCSQLAVCLLQQPVSSSCFTEPLTVTVMTDSGPLLAQTPWDAETQGHREDPQIRSPGSAALVGVTPEGPEETWGSTSSREGPGAPWCPTAEETLSLQPLSTPAVLVL